MKKILIALIAVAASAAAVLKFRGSRSEQQLWAEATDTVPPASETPATPPTSPTSPISPSEG